MTRLADDYAVCGAVLARSSSSFSLPIRLLPRSKRQATTALYAFCRMADDITDAGIGAPDRGAGGATGPSASRPADGSDPRRALAALRHDLDEAFAGHGGDPVLRAVADTARRYGIPRQLFLEILDGVGMDLEPPRFAAFDELEDYCRKVASAVGLAAIHIWGFRSDAALGPAHACGVAFQLTNILRDVREDTDAGRVYLPLEDFEACGAEVPASFGGSTGSGTQHRRGEGGGMECVIRRLVDRAATFYERARSLDPLLSTDGRIVFRAMYGSYGAIFRKIAAAPRRVLDGKVMPRKGRLAAAAMACVVLGPGRVGQGGGR